jgi:hypothetical protein
MTMANYQAQGTAAAALTATNCTPTIPTHAVGDLLIAFVATQNETPNTPSGWTAVPGGTVTANGARITAFYRIAESTSETDPTFNFTTNHVYAVVLTYRNAHVTHPFHASAIACSVASSSIGTICGLGTLVDDCLIVQAVAWNPDNAGPLASAESNGSLGSFTERHDGGTDLGNGSGLIIYDGTKASAGAVDVASFTSAAGSTWAQLTLAIAPIADKAVAGTVTIENAPAPNGGAVEVVDETQPAASYLCTTGVTAGGSGAFSLFSPYDDHDLRVIYDDGTKFGASAVGRAA